LDGYFMTGLPQPWAALEALAVSRQMMQQGGAAGLAGAALAALRRLGVRGCAAGAGLSGIVSPLGFRPWKCYLPMTKDLT
jgi:hypothetical protein